MLEPRYTQQGNRIFYKGKIRVTCYGESADLQENISEAYKLAEEITKLLNEWPETLDSFGKKGVK